MNCSVSTALPLLLKGADMAEIPGRSAHIWQAHVHSQEPPLMRACWVFQSSQLHATLQIWLPACSTPAAKARLIKHHALPPLATNNLRLYMLHPTECTSTCCSFSFSLPALVQVGCPNPVLWFLRQCQEAPVAKSSYITNAARMGAEYEKKEFTYRKHS